MSQTSLFPLPLVPFEEYMLLDDRPGYPMSVFARMRFRGRLDRAVMESALHAAMERHPLLRALVRQTGRNRWEWADAGHLPVPLRWIDLTASRLVPPVPGIDLRRESGVRVWALDDTDTTELLYQVHHACADGAAAVHFLTDLFQAYAMAAGTASRSKGFRALETERLRDRGRWNLGRAERWRILRKHLRLIPAVARSLRRRPVPLLPHEPQVCAPLPPEGFPATLTRALDPGEYAALRSVASSLGATVNDVLVRALFLTLADWQARHGPDLGDCWRRVWIPVNLRTLADRWLPAANLSSTVFVDRRTADLADPDRLLASIHREMQLVKEWRIGLFLNFSMRLVKALAGSLRLLVRDDRCLATCVLSNLGSPLANPPTPKREGRIVLGEAVLEDLEMIAPLRPFTCANFCVFEYLGKLRITLHYDPRPMRAAQAEDLLETFLRTIRGSLAQSAITVHAPRKS